MTRPTLRTIARLLAPWRIIRRLEAQNQLLQADLATAKQDAEYLRGDLATAREAVRRLVRWGLEGYSSEVLRGVYNWFTINAMTGPLPPLPKEIAKRKAKASPGEHH